MELESKVVKMMDAVERGDLDAMASCYAPDAIQHHPLAGTPIRGRAQIRASVEIPSVWVFELGADGLAAAERDYFDSAVLHRQLHPSP